MPPDDIRLLYAKLDEIHVEMGRMGVTLTAVEKKTDEMNIVLIGRDDQIGLKGRISQIEELHKVEHDEDLVRVANDRDYDTQERRHAWQKAATAAAADKVKPGITSRQWKVLIGILVLVYPVFISLFQALTAFLTKLAK
jgi:hypothetical protein